MNERKIPAIVTRLLENQGERLLRYFQVPDDPKRDNRIWAKVSALKGSDEVQKWIEVYQAKARSLKLLDHDEPWLTLVALYGLFGDQGDLANPKRISTINQLFKQVFSNRKGNPDSPQFDQLAGVNLEVSLPEILRYREYVKNTVFQGGAYHLYPDRMAVIEDKLRKTKASFEGNTNLDALISGRKGDRHVHLFIEAKFLSDISKDISYVMVRNQIARNIDCAIDLMTLGGTNLDGLQDFWFVLLTPDLFRTEQYGGPSPTPLSSFTPDRSRLYCYKMNDYLNPQLLRRDLPHWENILNDSHWEILSNRIGWVTFKAILTKVVQSNLFPEEALYEFMAFFRERSLLIIDGVIK